MQVNFIITCYDKESYWTPLDRILSSFKTIKPNICLVYNGNDPDFDCDVRIENQGHQMGEYSLIKAGYEHLKNDGINLWVKLAVDSWLCNEEVLINILNQMSQGGFVYGGNFWNTKSQLSCDIFFANTEKVNFFDRLIISPEDKVFIDNKQAVLENFIWRAAKESGSVYIVWDREPVHPNNRDECRKLKWTMHHDLERNKANRDKWENSVSLMDHFYETAISQPFKESVKYLRELAADCKSIIQYGFSDHTWALLNSRPDKFTCFSSQNKSIQTFNPKYQFLDKDSGSPRLSADMIYIEDGSLAALKIHNANKYIVVYGYLNIEIPGWTQKFEHGLTVYKNERREV